MQQQQQQQQNGHQPQQTTVPNAMQQAPVFQQPYVVRTPTFRRLKVRHTVFKVGVGLLLLSTLLFIVGYSAPSWVDNGGLWMKCSGSCASNTLRGPAWLEAVRAMETFALVLFLAAIAVELYQDVFKSPPPADNKAVEIIAAAAGGFGLIGIIIFGAKVEQSVGMSGYDYNGSYYYYSYRVYIQWGFGLATTGIILVLVSAALIAISRVRHAAHTAQAMAANGVFSPVRQPAPQPVMIPMQPMQQMQQMQPMQPMQMAQGYYQPYMPGYPYAYPYPSPGMTPMVAPTMAPPTAQGMPTSQGIPTSQGMPTSQVPAFYVMRQGQMVPVYNEMPATGGAATTAASAPQQPTDGSTAVRDAPNADVEANHKF